MTDNRRERLLTATIIGVFAILALAMLAVALGGCVGPVASPAESQRNTGAGATHHQTQALLAAAGALAEASASQHASGGRDAATGGLTASQATAGRDIRTGMDWGTVTVLCCLFGLAAFKTAYRMWMKKNAGHA